MLWRRTLSCIATNGKTENSLFRVVDGDSHGSHGWPSVHQRVQHIMNSIKTVTIILRTKQQQKNACGSDNKMRTHNPARTAIQQLKAHSVPCPAQKKRKAENDGSSVPVVSAMASAAEAVASAAIKPQSGVTAEGAEVKRAKKTAPAATVFCCAQCKHDCLVCVRFAALDPFSSQKSISYFNCYFFPLWTWVNCIECSHCHECRSSMYPQDW